MKRAATTFLILLVASVATAALASRADAALRVPQVPVLGGSLQGYLNSVGESINVLTDQEDTQAWAKTSSSTQTHTIQFQGSLNAAAHILGMYNSTAAVPVLYVLMSGAVGPLGFSTATFQAGGNLVINRFDSNANFLSTTTYAGADPNGFGFYLSGPNGTYYTQDFRNPGGLAQALAYRGTGVNAGTWFLCWEESNRAAGADDDFDDEVVLMESVNPTPVSRTSWGQVKSRFR
jgi:hypothetical protein